MLGGESPGASRQPLQRCTPASEKEDYLPQHITPVGLVIYDTFSGE